MAEHKITILNRITMPEAGIELVCNNPTDTIRFEFDEEWSGIAAKTARFSWDGKYRDVPFSGNVVEVPEIFQTNHVYVGVFADNIASTPAKVKCRYSIKCLGGKVVAPSEDVYAQIIALINAGINANDGVGVSNAYLDDAGHLFITLTTGESIDCGKAQGKDGKDGENGKDGAGAKEYAAVLESIAENEAAIEQNTNDLDAFEKNRPFNLTGNPVQIESFEGMPLKPITVLEPQQQGSGDPYPAGGGRNLCSLGSKTVSYYEALENESVIPAGQYTFSAVVSSNDTDSDECYVAFFDAYLGNAVGALWVKRSTGNDRVSGVVTLTADAKWIYLYASWNAAYGEGDTVTFKDIQIEPGATASEYQPYSNIRPISGYDALKLTATGKNLLNNVRYYDNTHTDIRAQYDNPLLLKAGVTYTLSTNIKADGLYFVDASGEGNTDAEYLLKYAYQVASLEYTPTTDIRCLFIAIFNNGVPNGTTVQLEVGSATAHEPYQGKAHTVQIGQTVYGGKFDWLTGKFVVTNKLVTYNGSEGWFGNSGGNDSLFAISLDATVNSVSASSHTPVVNEIVPQSIIKSGYYTEYGVLYMNLTGTQRISVEEFRAKLAASPVQIVYKLSNPVEIQLTSHEILALQGVNTLYGDGKISISGRTDMQAVVSNLLKRIKALEATINS